MSAVRTLALLFVTAVAVNYPWELAQAPLYEWPGEARNPLWHCFVASLGDGLLVLLVFSAGWLGFRRRTWFKNPGRIGYLLMLGTGLVIAMGVEWIAVHLLHRWSYTPLMPTIPGLETGLVPISQMLLLPPAIFWIATRRPRRWPRVVRP